MSSILNLDNNIIFNYNIINMKNKNIIFHEDIAIADTAFTIKGKNESQLFENAGKAFVMTMADIIKVIPKLSKSIELHNKKLDILLFDFLNELLFYKDSEGLLFSKFKVKIKRYKEMYILNANIWGENVDPEKHRITTDIKAITMHMFKVVKKKDGYEARVVVDI
jgi:SHS2 domain-containing protein